MLILREEDNGLGNTPLSLTQLVCRHINSNLLNFTKDPRFTLLPGEVKEKINEEAIFCIQEEMPLIMN